MLELEIVVFGVVEKFLLENCISTGGYGNGPDKRFLHGNICWVSMVVFTVAGNVFRRSYFKIWHESVMDFMGGLDDNLSGSHEYCKE